MEKARGFFEIVEAVCERDTRYKPDSYEFVMQALQFTQKKLKRTGHVSGRELSEGIRQYALKTYGPMARTVLEFWGIHTTEDFGNIVFNMISVRLFSKTEDDTLDDFRDVYRFESAFKHVVSDIAQP
ncbi:MAG: Minf_1886 family protein [Candidatus Omnitrophota bacterium]